MATHREMPPPQRFYEIAGRLSPPNAYVQWDAAHKWAFNWLNHHVKPTMWRYDIVSMVAGRRELSSGSQPCSMFRGPR